MMNFFIMWPITIVISFIFEFKNEFKMFKDFADIGYKVNTDKLTDLSTMSATSNALNASLTAMLIPFFNIACTLARRKKYEENKELIFEQYLKLGIIEEMSDEEFEEYKKNPTGVNALMVPLKKQVYDESKNISFGTITIVEPNGEESVVNIKLDLNKEDKEDMIEIITSRGPISKFSKEEQKEFIREHLIESFKKGESKFGSREAFIKELCDKENVNVSDAPVLQSKPDDKSMEVQPLSRLEQYKQLKKSIEENGFLYGEDMVIYHELKEEFESEQKLSLK